MVKRVNSNVLAATAIVSGVVPNLAKAQDVHIKDETQSEISQVFENSGEKLGDGTLSSDEFLSRLAMEEKLKEEMINLKNKKEVQDMIDFYGENGFKDKIEEMVRIIAGSPDEFGSFDSKGEYSLNNNKKIQKLYDMVFEDYLFEKGEDRYKKIMPIVIGVIFVILGGIMLYGYGEPKEK